MRIIFAEGSSRSPSIQWNILQTGLRILHSQNPQTQKEVTAPPCPSAGHFGKGWIYSPWFWVTSVPADIHTTEILLPGPSGQIQLAEIKISSPIWGALQHPNTCMVSLQLYGVLDVSQKVLDTSSQRAENNQSLASLVEVWPKSLVQLLRGTMGCAMLQFEDRNDLLELTWDILILKLELH